MRRSARTDANHAAVVKRLRAIGASVEDLSAVGGGCHDLAVGYHGRNIFLEVKDGTKPPSARKLTPDQLDWHARWRGQVTVVESADEAERVVFALTHVDVRARVGSPQACPGTRLGAVLEGVLGPVRTSFRTSVGAEIFSRKPLSRHMCPTLGEPDLGLEVQSSWHRDHHQHDRRRSDQLRKRQRRRRRRRSDRSRGGQQ